LGLVGRFEIRTTSRWETPTKLNSKPLSISEGRGSLVFYNPASFFRFPMTGLQFISSTIALEEQADLTLDFSTWVKWLYPVN
jgi:hypothetical protein